MSPPSILSEEIAVTEFVEEKWVGFCYGSSGFPLPCYWASF